MSYKHHQDKLNYHRRYRILNREKMNRQNMLLRRKKGDMPREVWFQLLKDSEVQRARVQKLKHKDPQAWETLISTKRSLVKASLISEACADCTALFGEVPRCSRNPDLCRSCWGVRYTKKLAKNKKSLLYTPLHEERVNKKWYN